MTIINTAAPEASGVPLPSFAEQLRSIADELDRQAREAAKTSHPAFQSGNAVEQPFGDYWMDRGYAAYAELDHTKAEREANGRRVFVLAHEADQVFQDLGFDTHGVFCDKDACEVEINPDEFWPVFEVGDRVVRVSEHQNYGRPGTPGHYTYDNESEKGWTGVITQTGHEPGNVDVKWDDAPHGSVLYAGDLELIPQPAEPEAVEEKPAEAVPSFNVGDKVKIIDEPYWRWATARTYIETLQVGDLATVTGEPDDDGDYLVRGGSTGSRVRIAPEVLELVREDRPLAAGDRVRAVRDTTSFFGNPISAGWTGTVRHIRGAECVAVDWDNGSPCNVPLAADLERISEPKPLAAGDRVRILPVSPVGPVWFGKVGTIIQIPEPGYGFIRVAVDDEPGTLALLESELERV